MRDRERKTENGGVRGSGAAERRDLWAGRAYVPPSFVNREIGRGIGMREAVAVTRCGGMCEKVFG